MDQPKHSRQTTRSTVGHRQVASSPLPIKDGLLNRNGMTSAHRYHLLSG